MAKKIGGVRKKSRYKLKKDRRARGKLSVSRFMQSFKIGQKVHLKLESSYHKGQYHSRFVGKSGFIRAQRGRCYEVAINDNGKEKLLIAHPIHLIRGQNGN